MSNDEVMVFNTVTPLGRRKLFVKRAGSSVDVNRYVEMVPEISRGEILFDEFEMPMSKRMTWHCLMLEWPTRELIRFEAEDPRVRFDGFKCHVRVKDVDGIPAVAWTIEPGGRVSGALHCASEYFWSTLGVWPRWGLLGRDVQRFPETHDLGEACLKLRAADWMWKGMVVVL